MGQGSDKGAGKGTGGGSRSGARGGSGRCRDDATVDRKPINNV